MKRSSKPIASRSQKTQRKYKDRVQIVEQLLAERPFCEACKIYATVDESRRVKVNRSVDIHELKSRGRGGSITDISNLLAVCRFPCHRRITDNPKEAEWCGLALPGWADADIYLEAIKRRDLLASGVHPGDPSWW